MKALRPYPKITITPKGEAALTGGHPSTARRRTARRRTARWWTW